MAEMLGKLLEKPKDLGTTNAALELTDAMAPFLEPVPSDDSEFIKTVAEFALELSPRQNAVLTKLDMLCEEPEISTVERSKLRLFVAMYLKNKRYHDAKFFISDAIASMSWRKFVQAGQMQGNVTKTGQM